MFNTMIPPISRQLSAQSKHNPGQIRARPGCLELGWAEASFIILKHFQRGVSGNGNVLDVSGQL